MGSLNSNKLKQRYSKLCTYILFGKAEANLLIFIFRAETFDIHFDNDAVWLTAASIRKALAIWIDIIIDQGGTFPDGIVRLRLHYDSNSRKGPSKTALTACIVHEIVRSQVCDDYLPLMMHGGPEGRKSLLHRTEAVDAVQSLSSENPIVLTGVIGLTHTPDSPPVALRLETNAVLDLQALVKITDIKDAKLYNYWRFEVHLVAAIIAEQHSQFTEKKTAVPKRTQKAKPRRGQSASLTSISSGSTIII